MGLTRRQSEAIQQMIIEESRAAYASQQERHRILGEVDGEDDDLVVEGKGSVELPSALRHAIVDLIEAFYTNNRIYEGCEFDNGLAAKRATEHLFRLVEADVKETVDMLQSGDFDDMDENEIDLPPMHPRASGKPGGVTGGTGEVSVGKPEPTGMRGNLPDPKHGYPGTGGEEDVDLPPMHPRGRR